MKKIIYIGLALSIIACSKDEETTNIGSLANDNSELYAGGEHNTVFDFSENAFGQVSPALTGNDGLNFFVGNSFFNQNWVTAPASTTARDGVGPTFNAHSCSACHFKDGRGRPPLYDGENSTGFLIRLSVPGTDVHGGPKPHANYGGQLNPQAILGVQPEGEVHISYIENSYTFPDGEPYSLRTPVYTFSNLNYGPLDDALFSPRIGQQMIGLGLLETIKESDILQYVDEADVDGDGVSGKANYVYHIASNSNKIGRFGWKANQPTIRQQVAGAFLGDIGTTTSIFPVENCTSPQNDCVSATNGGTPELEDNSLDNVELYALNLAVPARRDISSSNVKNGKNIFNTIGCATCHVPSYVTGINYRFPNLSEQKIFPYTDLLLHDMGVELADNRPDYLADGNEWRTQPLWGIGLIEVVNNHTFFLHDGRARNLTEAIMWHGGEGKNSKNQFYQLSKSDRDDLITFLKSL